MAVQELVERRLKTMIAAMHDEGVGLPALNFGVDWIRSHDNPRLRWFEDQRVKGKG
jgi:hypothetical protein